MSTSEDVVARVRAGLRQVYDPELGIDIVAMGLVYDVRVEGDTVVVEMTLTTPGCPVSDSLPADAFDAASAAAEPLGMAVDLRLVWDPPWMPEMLSHEVAVQLRR